MGNTKKSGSNAKRTGRIRNAYRPVDNHSRVDTDAPKDKVRLEDELRKMKGLLVFDETARSVVLEPLTDQQKASLAKIEFPI